MDFIFADSRSEVQNYGMHLPLITRETRALQYYSYYLKKILGLDAHGSPIKFEAEV